MIARFLRWLRWGNDYKADAEQTWRPYERPRFDRPLTAKPCVDPGPSIREQVARDQEFRARIKAEDARNALEFLDDLAQVNKDKDRLACEAIWDASREGVQQ